MKSDLMRPDLMKQCVLDLANVKSKQDIDAALGIYHCDAKLISVGLNVEANGSEEIRQQLSIFFNLFPDYLVEISQVACNESTLLATGFAQLTPLIPGQLCPTIKQSVAFEFAFRDQRIVRETFYLDFGQICEKTYISPEQLMSAINLHLNAAQAAAL